MQITRLRLLGFKSFVDPTEVDIAPGLTGVVGPNGCGKSNLLEALRWVMGESRPSVMRGDGMDDVIFAGSATRPPRHHAEVAVTLDNRARLAPAGFNDGDALEVVRRITRDAGSAYRASGREARARDVQMLFADASTGAHSPSLVRQGQIAELINAKPRARRRVLEEAAGISGLYQRRHEAELKLRATEANLGRVADVLEALAGQIAVLVRQAKQAARYREIAAALRRAEALLAWRHWHDAEAERSGAAAALLAATRVAGVAQTEAAAAARGCAAAEEALPALREEDAIAGAVLQRIALERDRIQAEAGDAERRIAELRGRMEQMAADRAREAALDEDAAQSITRLRGERDDLEAAGTGHDAALGEARVRAEAAGNAMRAAEASFDAEAERAARLAAEKQAAERGLEEARRRDTGAARALEEASAALTKARSELTGVQAAGAAAQTRAEAAVTAAERAEADLNRAESEAAAARAEEARSRARLAEAEGAAKALRSEEAGLAGLLAPKAGAAAQLVDELAVERGYEAALGAALGDDLAYPAQPEGRPESGWRMLPRETAPGVLPAAAETLAGRVAAPAELGRRLAAVGVVEAADGARLQASLSAGQRLVSRNGDLWRWDGLHIAAGDAPSATAQRLQQRNRLAAVSAQREAAEAEVEAAAAIAAGAAAALVAASDAERSARTARKQADQAASEARREADRAAAATEALQARVAGLTGAGGRRGEEHRAAQAAVAEAEAALQSAADPQAARAAVERARVEVEAARLRMLTYRAEADELDRAGKEHGRRLAEISRELEGWEARLAEAATRLGDLEGRAVGAAAALAEAEARPGELQARLADLAGSFAAAEMRRKSAADALAGAETEVRALTAVAREAERAAGEAREARARSEALAEAAQTQASAALERLQSETGRTPETLLAELALEASGVLDAERLEAEAAGLRRQREALGAVNLRAEQDAREVEAEHATLAGERADLEAAIQKLRHGIANLNREGRERLLGAFDEVNRNFGTLFRHLFGGGEASLMLVECDDPLEAGLEIMCQPPGKKLATLSLLSGGEQTLTALALIFAVFLANPSPICVLDEVDAPLDDANVTRFCDLLDEMTRRTRTRFLIITHHAVTMARMDRLYGVTMAEPGVSQLVSVNLTAAERLVETVG